MLSRIQTSRPNVKLLATSSLFASFYLLIRLIPTFPLVGVSGGSFSASDVIAPIYGLVLGPLYGSIAVCVGTILSFAIRPPTFLFFDFLPPALNALTVGLLYERKAKLAFLIYISALAVFMMNPFTSLFIESSILGFRMQLPFHWLHILAPIVVAASEGTRPSKVGATKHAWRDLSSYALMGTMAQHSAGSALFEYVFGSTGMISKEGFLAIWSVVFWIYPIERAFFVTVTTLLGVPISRAYLNRVR